MTELWLMVDLPYLLIIGDIIHKSNVGKLVRQTKKYLRWRMRFKFSYATELKSILHQ